MATNYKEVIYKTSLSLWVVLNENEETNYLITELKKENDKLKKENDKSKKENDKLKKENDKLKKENDKLKKENITLNKK